MCVDASVCVYIPAMLHTLITRSKPHAELNLKWKKVSDFPEDCSYDDDDDDDAFKLRGTTVHSTVCFHSRGAYINFTISGIIIIIYCSAYSMLVYVAVNLFNERTESLNLECS